MSRHRRSRSLAGWLVVVLLAGLAAACTRSEPPPPSIFLWRVTRAGALGEVFLLGSVHLRSRDGVVLDRAVTEAVIGSERAVFEIDLDEATSEEVAAFVAEHGTLPEGETLQDHLSPDVHAAWTEAVAEIGLPATIHARMQPWLAAQSLEVGYLANAGYEWDVGVDHVVFALAKREPSRKREIDGLETPIDQLRAFSGLEPEVQEAMIRDTIRAIETQEVENVLQMYERGDEAGLARYLEEMRETHPDLEPFSEALLDRRNEQMAAGILPYLDRPGRTFVTVGAAHLFGEKGLLALLRASGAEVAPVSALGPAPAEHVSYAQEWADPESERFVRPADGFSVVMGSRPAAQEIQRDGGTVRTYTASVGLTGGLVVSVLRPTAEAGETSASIEAIATGMLGALGVRPGEPRVLDVAGETGVHLQGLGDGVAGDAVAVRHQGRVYVLLGFAMTDDDRVRSEVRDRWDSMRETFRWVDRQETMPTTESPS